MGTGKLDASVEVQVKRGDQTEKRTLPFELKTGENKGNAGSISHRAQVMLYTLLMSDFYGTIIVICAHS